MRQNHEGVLYCSECTALPSLHIHTGPIARHFQRFLAGSLGAKLPRVGHAYQGRGDEQGNNR